MEVDEGVLVSTLGQIVTLVEKMPAEDKEILLKSLHRKDAIRLAEEHDNRERDSEPKLTEEEIVALVREVREELSKNGY